MLIEEVLFYTGLPFIQPDTAIVDVAARDGAFIAPFVEALDDTQSFVLCNATGEARRQYAKDERVTISTIEPSHSYPAYGASLTLCYHGLNHLPVNKRQALVNSVYAHTMPGGAFLLAENVLADSAQVSEILGNVVFTLDCRNMVSLPPAWSVKNAAPVPSSWNTDMLYQAGFHTVETIYKLGNTAAWLAVRER